MTKTLKNLKEFVFKSSVSEDYLVHQHNPIKARLRLDTKLLLKKAINFWDFSVKKIDLGKIDGQYVTEFHVINNFSG